MTFPKLVRRLAISLLFAMPLAHAEDIDLFMGVSASNSDLPNVLITDPILGLESRNSTLKRRFSYGLDIYQPDSGSASPDPDLV